MKFYLRILIKIYKWIHDENACGKCIYFIFFYFMYDDMKMYIWNLFFFYWMNICLNIIRFRKCINTWCYKDVWMNALALFETIFFMKMHVCYLHDSTWMTHETLDDSMRYVYMYEVLSGCINEWIPSFFFNIMRMYRWMKIYFLFT